MDFKQLGINALYVGPASQQPINPKEAEEVRLAVQRKQGKRITPKHKQVLWTPNQDNGANSNLTANLQDFAQENNSLFNIAIRIVTFALDQRMSDVTMRLPISIGIGSDPSAKSEIIGGDDEGLYLYLQVHLDHDLFGSGVVRVISDEEYEVVFNGGKSLPPFYATTEQDVFAYIANIGEERSHDLDTLREFIADEIRDSDLQEIEDRLNRMLEDYHLATDDLAERLITMLEEKGATYGTEDSASQMTKSIFPPSLLVAKIDRNAGVRRLLTTKAFKIESATDDDEVYPLLNEYRAADYTKGAYLIRAIRDLTLCGITVKTARSFGGDHISKTRPTSEGKLPIVDVPALDYATDITVWFSYDDDIETKPIS